MELYIVLRVPKLDMVQPPEREADRSCACFLTDTEEPSQLTSDKSIATLTPQYLENIDVLTLIPEYDEDGQFSSLVIVTEYAERIRIVPMLNLSTEISYLDISKEVD